MPTNDVSAFPAVSGAPTDPTQPGPHALKIARIAKVFLVNFYLTAVGLMLLLFIPFQASLSPIRRDLFVDQGDFSRFQPNLRNEPYTHDSPVGLGFGYKAILMSTNNEGFRDRDHPVEKPTGTFRIATFGDSFFFGLSVAQEDTVASQIETELNRSGDSHYDVLNFGIPGLNLEGMGKMNRAFGMKYDPDLAVYSFICDDLSTTDTLTSHRMSRAVERLVGSNSPIIAAIQNPLSMLKMARYTFDFQVLRTFPSFYQKRLLVVLGYLQSLADEGGHDVILVDYCRDAIFKPTLDSFNAEENGRIHYFSDFEVELNPNDGHPTAACNQELARKLAPVVREIEASRKGQG